MPKHKKRNTFYWITWKVKWNLASLCHIPKEIISLKNSTKGAAWETSSNPFCVCNELSITSIGKLNFWSNLLIFDM